MRYSVADVIPWWRSFAFRFVGLYTIVAFALIIGAVVWIYERQKDEVKGKFGLVLESIASTGSLLISGDDLDLIHSNQDTGADAFMRVRRVLADIRRENNLGEDNVYVLRPKAESFGLYEFVAMLQDKTFVGSNYNPPKAVGSLYSWVISKKDTVRTPPYRDESGEYISGIAPVLRKDGSVAGLLQIDYGIHVYIDELMRERHFLVAGVGALFAMFLSLGIWMHRSLRRNVTALLGGTFAIQREQYDHVVVIETEDELKSVADALNQALRKLKERFEMLKFLPRHTARMIEAAAKAGGVQRAHAKRVRVTVFESDIRGFTRLSQSMSPEDVVMMLNDYIRVQAEIVEAAGGSIDKFMGDAVLAVFEGEGMERRALESALAIQGALESMNKSRPVPVRVGIGITVGELVMGNMGSDKRMEHTIIGSTVNLAARLCSTAGPGEIVIAEDLRHALGTELGFALSAAEEVRVKGFDLPVKCYRAAGRPIEERSSVVT
jgi:class 3 adenylate cyclase